MSATGSLVTPHDLQAERTLLGALLLHGERIHEVIGLLDRADFWLPEHGALFAAMVTLAEQGRDPDPLALRAVMGVAAFEAAGGLARIAGLMDGMPAGTPLETCARLIREAAIRRRFRRGALELAQLAQQDDIDAEALLARGERVLGDLAMARDPEARGFVPARDLVMATWPRLEAVTEQQRPALGVLTGYGLLDQMTRGLHPGQLTLLAARPSVGKSSLATCIAVNAASRGSVVAFLSLEMTRDEVTMRALTSRARVDSHRLLAGSATEPDMERLGRAMNKIAESPLYISDDADLTVLALRSQARRLQARHGLDLLIVDYLQLLTPARRRENRTQDIGEISRGLKQLAMELAIPVLALSQLNRDQEREHRKPRLSDLRDSGTLEQDANNVWFLWVPDSTTPDRVELLIEKHRNGPKGVVPLRWVPEYTRFFSIDDEDRE